MKKRSQFDFMALNDFLYAIQSYTPDLIWGVDKPLHHYTDLNGLKGIIQENDLWLTHSKYSNDSEEIKHGEDIVKEVIKQERTNTEKSSPDKIAFLDKLAEKVDPPSQEGVYICCFCLKDDLLSQWRGYGANGTGVSLQFNAKLFDYITGPDSPHGGLMRIWKVFYETEQQKYIVKKAIDFAFNNVMTQEIEEMAQRAADAIQFFIPTFKNQGFEEEMECRLIFTPPPDCKIQPQFRVTRGMLVPYYSLQKLSSNLGFPQLLPISGIRIGPSASKSLNEESAKMLLNQAGYFNVVVQSSNTPYRG